MCTDSVVHIINDQASCSVILSTDYWPKRKKKSTYRKSEVWFLQQFETKRTKFHLLSWSRCISYPSKFHKNPNLRIIQNCAHRWVTFILIFLQLSSVSKFAPKWFSQEFPNTVLYFIFASSICFLDQLAERISSYSLKRTNSKINLTFERLACDSHSGEGRVRTEEQSRPLALESQIPWAHHLPSWIPDYHCFEV